MEPHLPFSPEEYAAAPTSLNQLLTQIALEIERAESKFAPFNSAHEGFAVLWEEFDELKAHVWCNQKRRDISEMRKEAIQVAAMAIRFVRDVCDERRGRV